jgi:divalent metal cation (Fe/Co/Zn/Cd) transporter
VDGEISVKDGHDISHQLKDRLRDEIPELGHVLIHVEPFVPLPN